MATIKFLIRSKSNPSKIYVRVRDGKVLDLKTPTHWHIDPQQWNAKSGKPKSTDNKELKSLYKSMNLLYAKILAYLNAKNSANVSSNDLIQLINPHNKPVNPNAIPTTLLKYYEYYIENLNNQLALNKITQSTIKKYKVVLRILERLELHYKETYKIAEVNLSFIRKFEQFSLETMKYSPNTIGRAIKFVKTVCRNARLNGIETHLQLDAIKGYTKKTQFIILTTDELRQISEVKLQHNYQDNARDWLLISCYTGQRVSDFLRFNKEMIVSIKSSKDKSIDMIEFTQQKTKKIIKLPISSEVRKLLDKKKGYFPKQISDQKYNLYIKEVCKVAGINDMVEGSKLDTETKRKKAGKYEKWELVTSHIGRRSFASNYYGQIPTPMIMYATGHSTEQMLLKYIGKTNDDKALELAQYLK